MATTTPEAATLDEARIERVRQRIGIPRRSRHRPHNEVATTDSIRHFALGYGDDNPLWTEPAYAAATRWQSVIAPPMYPMSAGNPAQVTWTDEQAGVMGGGDPLAGIGQYLCGERWVFLRPVRPGNRLVRIESMDGAELKRSSFGGGVGALVSHRQAFHDAGDNSVVSIRFADFWHAERTKSKQSGKYRTVERSPYSAEDLAALDELYEREQVRGAEPRYWDDVRVGDDLGTIAKGPITLTDVLNYHAGIGVSAGSGKVGYKQRRRIPGLYVPNEFGVPDTVQRCHWEQGWAEQLGHPAPYDYGAMRTNWMINLITNWAGDDGWLWRMAASVMRFNYLGDAHRVSGRVTAVRMDARRACAEVEIQGTNQRGEVTCRSTATVLLPSKDQPAVDVPTLEDTPIPAPIGPRSSAEVVE